MEERFPEGTTSGTRTELCDGAGCREAERTGQGRRIVRGYRICERCRAGLAGDLRQFPGLYATCGEVLGGGRTAGGVRERTSGGALSGMPFNAAAADTRSAILSVLASWSGLVAEARGLHRPGRTAAEMSAFLLRHADWLARHPAADEASTELALLVRSARRVTHEGRSRRVFLGQCPEPGCEGALHAYVRQHAKGRGTGRPSEIRCDAGAAHQWTGEQWVRLGQRLRGPALSAAAWLAVPDICALWGIAPGSVYRLASEEGWRRRKNAGRTYYHEADVLRTLQERSPQGA